MSAAKTTGYNKARATVNQSGSRKPTTRHGSMQKERFLNVPVITLYVEIKKDPWFQSKAAVPGVWVGLLQTTVYSFFIV